MISLSFVNGTPEPVISADDSIKFMEMAASMHESLIQDITEFNEKYAQHIFESEITGYENIETIEILEKEGDNIFKKIGDAIIGLFKQFAELLKGFMKKISNSGFKNKSDMEKIEKLIKEHPSMKEQIIAHTKDFDFRDIDSLSKMEEAFEEILKMDEQKAIKKKWDKTKKMAAATVTVAAGVVTIDKALSLLKNKHIETERNLNNNFTNAMNNVRTMERQMAEMRMHNEDNVHGGQGGTMFIKGDIDLLNEKIYVGRDMMTRAGRAYQDFLQKEDRWYNRIINFLTRSNRTNTNSIRNIETLINNSGIRDISAYSNNNDEEET